MNYDDLTAYQADCYWPSTRHSDACNTAIHQWCTDEGFASGFGPLENRIMLPMYPVFRGRESAMSKVRLNRRSLLRGMLAGSSVMVGLPLLDIMLDGNGESFSRRHRNTHSFWGMVWGNGVRPGSWVPTPPAPIGRRILKPILFWPFETMSAWLLAVKLSQPHARIIRVWQGL